MLARLRVNVPDLPGTLGRVASAVGSSGADIVKVDVLESESGRALDDLFVEVRDAEQAERSYRWLAEVPGVYPVGIQLAVPPIGGHTDLELLAQVMAEPRRGARTLVDGAPGALGADWAALVRFGPDDAPGPVLAVSPLGPDPSGLRLVVPRRLAALRLAPPGSPEPYGGSALIPLVRTDLGLVLVRLTGPQFHRTELWRLEQLGRVLGEVLAGISVPVLPGA